MEWTNWSLMCLQIQATLDTNCVVKTLNFRLINYKILVTVKLNLSVELAERNFTVNQSVAVNWKETDEQKIHRISTYEKYLLESFVDEYQWDECYEYLLHEAREISHQKSTLEHHDDYHKHSDPYADPQPKHQKLHFECITHLQTTSELKQITRNKV